MLWDENNNECIAGYKSIGPKEGYWAETLSGGLLNSFLLFSFIRIYLDWSWMVYTYDSVENRLAIKESY
jgi:hypothetical protein